MAARGKRPDPAHLRLLKGKGGNGAMTGNDEPVGPPPLDWTGPQKAFWHEVCAAAPDGVLTKKDRLLVETVARLLSDIRNPNVPTTPALYTQMRVALAEIHATPSSRERLAASGPSVSDDAAAKYFAELEDR